MSIISGGSVSLDSTFNDDVYVGFLLCLFLQVCSPPPPLIERGDKGGGGEIQWRGFNRHSAISSTIGDGTRNIKIELVWIFFYIWKIGVTSWSSTIFPWQRIGKRMYPLADFIDLVLAKTSSNLSKTENDSFGLVFAKTGSIVHALLCLAPQ